MSGVLRQLWQVIRRLRRLGVVLAQVLLGYFASRRFLAVQNSALYFTAVTANWLVVFSVVYLSPYVSGVF